MECGLVYEFAHATSIDDIITQYRRYPLGGGIELSCKCNLSCVHCYAKPGRKDPDLSKEQLYRIIDDLYDNGAMFLYLTGGEPLARPDFTEIYTYIKKRGFMVEVLSNGTLIDEDIIDLFKEYPPLKVDLTMYGSSPTTYRKVTGCEDNYNKFINGVQLLEDNNINFQLKTVGIKETISDLQDMRQFAREKGVRFRYTFNMFPDKDSRISPMEHAVTPHEALLEELKDPERMAMWRALYHQENVYKRRLGEGKKVPVYMCNYAKYSFFITHEGVLQGCNKNRFYGYSLLEESFETAWEKLGEIKLIEASQTYQCAQCQHFPMCDHCAAENRMLAEDGNEETPAQYKCDFVNERCQHFEKE